MYVGILGIIKRRVYLRSLPNHQDNDAVRFLDNQRFNYCEIKWISGLKHVGKIALLSLGVSIALLIVGQVTRQRYYFLCLPIDCINDQPNYTHVVFLIGGVVAAAISVWLIFAMKSSSRNSVHAWLLVIRRADSANWIKPLNSVIDLFSATIAICLLCDLVIIMLVNIYNSIMYYLWTRWAIRTIGTLV